MRFELRGAIVFSGDLGPAAEALDGYLGEIQSGPLQKGVPEGEEGPRVEAHSVAGNELDLTIVSGRYVRAHEALLRLRKELSARMGKEHRLGARAVRIDSYVIQFHVSEEPTAPVHVPFASSMQFDGTTATLTLTDVTEEFLSRNYVDRLVALVREKVEARSYEGKEEFYELIWSAPRREVTYDADPTEDMAKRGWVQQGPGKGRWFFRPQAAAIIRAMERIALEEVLHPLGFQEVISSSLVPFDVWLKTGHLKGVANEIYYFSEPATRSEEAWEELSDLVKVTREVPKDKLVDLLEAPTAGMTYAQCPNIYWSFQRRTLADEDLPVLVYDRTANSYRYESGGRHGIERVDEFHRIEPVYIGNRDQLGQLREGMIDRYRHVFNDVLELEWRMAWVSPFYLQQAGMAGGDERDEAAPVTDAHREGTIDYEAYLPYRGSREDSEWLEFQNLSILGDRYTSAFNIKSSKEELISGCSGIGLERWTAVFLAQHGLDPTDWPEGFKVYLPDLPKGFSFH
ncbi:MAG: serine--tRNA ligase [Thermoplasmata archaeon]|nr:serine--tRNA ligase [Thermoplasmata archaeon]